MNRKILSFTILCLGAPLLLTTIVFMIFYLTQGPEMILNSKLWLYIGVFFFIFGGLAFVARCLTEHCVETLDVLPNDWEIERLQGRWRFVLVLTGQLSSLAVLAISLGYFFTPSVENPDHSQSTIAYILLMLISIIGALVFSLRLWKNKEGRFKTESRAHTQKK